MFQIFGVYKGSPELLLSVAHTYNVNLVNSFMHITVLRGTRSHGLKAQRYRIALGQQEQIAVYHQSERGFWIWTVWLLLWKWLDQLENRWTDICSFRSQNWRLGNELFKSNLLDSSGYFTLLYDQRSYNLPLITALRNVSVTPYIMLFSVESLIAKMFGGSLNLIFDLSLCHPIRDSNPPEMSINMDRKLSSKWLFPCPRLADSIVFNENRKIVWLLVDADPVFPNIQLAMSTERMSNYFKQ